jgi:hypothetical protein
LPAPLVVVATMVVVVATMVVVVATMGVVVATMVVVVAVVATRPCTARGTGALGRLSDGASREREAERLGKLNDEGVHLLRAETTGSRIGGRAWSIRVFQPVDVLLDEAPEGLVVLVLGGRGGC